MKNILSNTIFILAALSLGCASNVYSQDFGKLFTAPEEREYLDYLRQEFLASTADAGFDIDDNSVPEIPQDEEADSNEFYLGGVMTRVDGGRTVWLNGTPTREGDLPSNTSIVVVDGITALKLVTDDASYVLKPGQTVDITTGEFWETFDRDPNAADQSPQPEAAEESVSPDVQISTPSISNTVETTTATNSEIADELGLPGVEFTPEQLQAIEVLRAMEISNFE